MAKRKLQPGSITAFTFNPTKDYRTDKYVPYLMEIETGFLEAGTIEPGLTDGDVDLFLKGLINRLKDSEQSAELPGTTATAAEPDTLHYEQGEKEQLVSQLMFRNLKHAFEKYGTLGAQDIIGLAKVIRSTLKFRSVGLHRRGYLTYLEGFLGQIGISTRQLTEAEVKALGLADNNPGEE